MTLTELLVELRIDLNDAGTAVWTDAQLTRAIQKSISLMSRLLPKRSIVEATLTREAVDEALTISSNTGTTTYKPIKVDSFTIDDEVLDTDYTINYLTGVVTEISANMIDGAYVCDYTLDPRMFDLSTLLTTDYIKIERVEYPAGENPPTNITFDVVGAFLIFRGDISLTTDKHIRITYLGPWTAPTASADGDYPEHLDNIITIGSAGQALIAHGENYSQRAGTAASNVLTLLATIGDLTLAAHGLTAPTAPTLGDPTSPTLHVFTAPTAPTLPTAPTAPTAPTPSYTDVVAALDLVSDLESSETGMLVDAVAYLTSGATYITTINDADRVAEKYAAYTKAKLDTASIYINRAIADLRNQEDVIALYASEVASYGSDVNSYANEMSGTVGKYREEIESERAAVASNGAMVAKYDADIREELMAVSEYEAEIRSYQTDSALYQSDIAAYNAKVNAIVQEAVNHAVQINNYLDISGRYLASGQAKINEMLAALGVKIEFPKSKALSEQFS